MYHYIGVDIAKDSFEAAFPQQADKATVLSFPNTQEGFSAFKAQLPPAAWVVMEASGPYHLQLAFFLYEQQLPLSVVNPLSVKRYAQMKMKRAKTDKKDAQLIASYARMEEPEQWQPQEQHAAELKQTLTVLEQLQKQNTALKNQQKALLLSPQQNEKSHQVLKKQLTQLDEDINELEQELKRLSKAYCQQSYKALTSITGIGAKTAAVLIAITGNFSRFATIKQLISYVGLSPRVYESGTSVKGRSRICKMGMGLVRKMLYVCSWSAKFHNPACKALYERLLAKGKPEKVIKVAIANKLLRVAFALGKKQVIFDKNYLPAIAC